MNAADFIARLETDNSQRRGTHQLAKPATEASIATWQKKHPQFPLPQSFADLLQHANGLVLLKDRTALAEVGGALRLFALGKLRWAAEVMYGEEVDSDDAMPAHFLGLGLDENHDWSPVLDTQTGQVLICDHIGGEEAAEVLDDFEQFLDWIVQTILEPRKAALEAEQAAKKARGKAKSSKTPVMEMEELHAVALPMGRIETLSLDAAGRRAVIAGAVAGRSDWSQAPSRTATLRLWNVAERREERTFDGHQEATQAEIHHEDGTFSYVNYLMDLPLDAAVISPDGRRVIASVQTGGILCYDADSGELLKRLDDYRWMGTLRFSPDGRRLLVAGGPTSISDGILRILDAATLECVRTWVAHKRHTTAGAFMPDGRAVVSAGWDKTVKIWDGDTGELRLELPAQKYPVAGVAASPDGKSLLVGSYTDRCVRLVDLASTSIVQEFPGHKAWVRALSFSPNGRLAATLDGQSVLRLWDISTGVLRAEYANGENDPGNFETQGTGLVFLPDGRHVMICGYTRRLRLLKIPDVLTEA